MRSAVVPRLLPPNFSPVKANSRVTLAGLLATGIAAPIGAGLQMIGSAWPLYGACAIFVAGTFLAFTLPHKVDSAKGERRARLIDPHHDRDRPPARPRQDVGADGQHPPGCAGAAARPATGRNRPRSGRRVCGPSAGPSCTGSRPTPLTGPSPASSSSSWRLVLREHPLAGQSAAVSLGIVGVAAGVGNARGTAVGSWLRARGPEVITRDGAGARTERGGPRRGVLLHTAGRALGAVAGFTQALSKLSLDAMIQRDVPEEVRTSAFARSETLLQMAWVVGGGIGIALPLNAVLGMSVAAGILALGAAASVRLLGPRGAARRTPAWRERRRPIAFGP